MTASMAVVLRRTCAEASTSMLRALAPALVAPPVLAAAGGGDGASDSNSEALSFSGQLKLRVLVRAVVMLLALRCSAASLGNVAPQPASSGLRSRFASKSSMIVTDSAAPKLIPRLERLDLQYRHRWHEQTAESVKTWLAKADPEEASWLLVRLLKL